MAVTAAGVSPALRCGLKSERDDRSRDTEREFSEARNALADPVRETEPSPRDAGCSRPPCSATRCAAPLHVHQVGKAVGAGSAIAEIPAPDEVLAWVFLDLCGLRSLCVDLVKPERLLILIPAARPTDHPAVLVVNPNVGGQTARVIAPAGFASAGFDAGGITSGENFRGVPNHFDKMRVDARKIAANEAPALLWRNDRGWVYRSEIERLRRRVVR